MKSNIAECIHFKHYRDSKRLALPAVDYIETKPEVASPSGTRKGSLTITAALKERSLYEATAKAIS